jgi:hypothetical protein
MKIETKHTIDGRIVLVDGEDTELMSPQRREWIMKKLLEAIDHRYLEVVASAICEKYGDITQDDEDVILIHTFE